MELLAEVLANPRDVLQQLFFLDNRQVLEPDPASQRTSTEGSSVLSGRDRIRELLARQKCAQRHARGDWLGDGDNIRHNAEGLEREHRSRAAEPTLNLVENKRGLVLIGKGAAFA